MHKVIKFLSWTISISSMIGAIFFCLNFVSFSLSQIGFNISESSVINDLIYIDYKLFYQIAFLTFMATFSLAGAVTYIGMFFLSELQINKILLIMMKFASITSLIVPMLFVLSKEQFNVLTTIISFLALFSFIVPKEILKKTII